MITENESGQIKETNQNGEIYHLGFVADDYDFDDDDENDDDGFPALVSTGLRRVKELVTGSAELFSCFCSKLASRRKQTQGF